MAHLILAVAALALLLTIAVYLGEVIGERRERQRTAADVQTLSTELHTQNAALMGIPVEAVEHGQLVAAEHLDRWQPALDRLAAHLRLRRAA